MGDEEFALASARAAADQGRLAQWVTDFLSSPGSDNATLAADLAFREVVYLGPVAVELDRLTPMAGPAEDGVAVPVAKGEWESDVTEMTHQVEEGWDPPPLLVSPRHDGYFLEDGNHRFETLRRSGATHAWAILVFDDGAARERFGRQHGSDGGPPDAGAPV